MAPNCKEKLPISEHAAPFSDGPSGKAVPEPSFEEPGTSSGFISLRREETEERDANVRVTKASYSYELDRYHKNAMLIFHVSSYQGSYANVEHVKDTFEKFRFEVEIHNNMTGEQLRNVCAQFFSRDFTEYGAVAVVVLAPIDVHGSFITPGENFTDVDIRSFLNSPLPTLEGKPKIFMCQVENWVKSSDHIANLEPWDIHSADVFEMYFPASSFAQAPQQADNWLTNLNGRPIPPAGDDILEIYCRADVSGSVIPNGHRLSNPLSWFCNTLERMGDQEDMLTIHQFCHYKLRQHIRTQPCLYISSSSLTKKLKLWRS